MVKTIKGPHRNDHGSLALLGLNSVASTRACVSYEALTLGHNIMLETGQLGRLLWESSGSKNSKGEPGGLAADACHCADAVSVRRKRRSVKGKLREERSGL